MQYLETTNNIKNRFKVYETICFIDIHAVCETYERLKNASWTGDIIISPSRHGNLHASHYLKTLVGLAILNIVCDVTRILVQNTSQNLKPPVAQALLNIVLDVRIMLLQVTSQNLKPPVVQAILNIVLDVTRISLQETRHY